MPTIHDPKFALPPVPATPFGSSAFMARGRVYVDELAIYDAFAPGTVKAALAQARVPGLDVFLSQRFSSGGWYDLFPGAYLASAVAKLRGVPYAKQLRENAHHHAERAHEGLRGVVLRALSPESIAVWAPRMSSYFHNFGAVETTATGPGYVRGSRSGIPETWVHGWSVCAMEFVEHVLRRAGARSPRVHALDVAPDGARSGVATYTVSFEIRWETAELPGERLRASRSILR